MSNEQTHNAIHRWLDGLNSGNVMEAITVLSPNYLGYLSGLSEPVRGPAAFAALYTQMIHSAFPDQHIEIVEEVVSGNQIAVQTQWTATHQGPFAGMPATGAKVTVVGTGIFTVEDNHIVEEWLQEDFLGLWQQISQAATQGR